MIHQTPDGAEWKTYRVGGGLHIAFRRAGEKLWKPLCDQPGAKLGCSDLNQTLPGDGLPIHSDCAQEAKRRGWI